MHRDPKSNRHVPYADNRRLVGTSRYVSVSTHLGIRQSRRDDLEAAGYMLLAFAKGRLPWEHLRSDNSDELDDMILAKKQSIPTEALGKCLPDAFAKYLCYCRGLGYDEQPDYQYLRGLWQNELERQRFPRDKTFDWSALVPKASDPWYMNFGRYKLHVTLQQLLGRRCGHIRS